MGTTFEFTSEPNTNGEHALNCPQCHIGFLSPITKDDMTGTINNIVCPSCGCTREPVAFLAEANKSEINAKLEKYITARLKKTFRNIKIK